jgi:hypothetical protein
VGQGVGAANSWEKKYRWRNAQRLCPKCSQPTIYKSKAEKGGGWFCWANKGGCGAQFRKGDPEIEDQVQGQVENPDPFDGENTLKKMSAKRSYIDATLRATATSGLFTQDVEDMEPEPKPNGQSAPPVQRQAPAPRPQAERPKPPEVQPEPEPPADPPHAVYTDGKIVSSDELPTVFEAHSQHIREATTPEALRKVASEIKLDLTLTPEQREQLREEWANQKHVVEHGE